MNPRPFFSAAAVAVMLTVGVTACGSSDEPTSVAVDDPELALPWPAPPTCISDRDRALPTLAALRVAA